MEGYTARQVADILSRDDPQMNLRTVRYYTQIGVVPPLEPAGNKRVYTERHLHYFRAILTLSKSGETLSGIRELLANQSIDEIVKLGEKLPLYQSDRLLEYDTHVVDEDVILSFSSRVSPERKRRMIEAIGPLAREGKSE